MKNRTTLYIIISCLLMAAFTSSCSIFNPDIQIEKRIALYFEVEEMAEDLIVSQDTLRINEFKFSLGQFNLEGEDLELGSSNNVRAFIFGYNESSESQRLVISVGLTISDNVTFDRYKMFLRPVPESANILDTEFFGNDGNYSMIIKGTYNQKDFTFRSKTSFDKEFMFEAVSLNDTRETIVVSKKISLADVFYDENGDLIDPTNSENSSQIMTNIQNGFEVEAYGSNIY